MFGHVECLRKDKLSINELVSFQEHSLCCVLNYFIR